jgi:flavin reductase (DIM6/NTAB) family NADH-FMN oxidoreductase RutF
VNSYLKTCSYFGAVCHDPLLISISICTRGSAQLKKDTLHNIEETKEFVVNIMSDWYVEAANHTSGEYPPEVDEISLSGLSTMPSTKVRPERIGDAAVQMECEVGSR